MRYLILSCLFIFLIANCSAENETSRKYIVDDFSSSKLNNWVYYVLKWTPKGTIKIDKKDYVPVFELSNDSNFFVKGKGALKIEHSSAAVEKYPRSYIDVTKRVLDTKLDCSGKYLVFDVLQTTGGGKFNVRARDGKNKYYYLNGQEDRRKLAYIKLNYQGIKRFVLDLSPLGKNGINHLEFVFYGDFVIYLSGIEITSDKNITQPEMKNKIKFEELPEEDAS